MDRLAAARVLGIPIDAAAGEVRAAYRRRIRATHPDRAGDAGHDEATLVIEAYRVLVAGGVLAPTAPDGAPRPEAPTARRSPPTSDDPADTVRLVDDETVGFAFPADEVFGLLMDVAAEIGDVTHVDPEAGLLEFLVAGERATPASVVVSLQGRSDRVDAFCTVEALDAGTAPPVSLVVGRLLDRLRARLAAH